MRKFKFTLIEVTVAMAVLSILMMLLMRFFTTAQNAWTTGEKRGTTYSDSRTFFELLDNAFKSSKEDDWTMNSKYVIFPGILPYGNSAGKARNITNIVVGQLFVDSDGEQTTDVEKYSNGKAGLTDGTTVNKNINTIIDNIIRIDFKFQDANFGAITGSSNRPAYIIVTLMMFGNNSDFLRWAEINASDTITPSNDKDSNGFLDKADDFFHSNGRRFVRTFALPQN